MTYDKNDLHTIFKATPGVSNLGFNPTVVPVLSPGFNPTPQSGFSVQPKLRMPKPRIRKTFSETWMWLCSYTQYVNRIKIIYVFWFGIRNNFMLKVYVKIDQRKRFAPHPTTLCFSKAAKQTKMTKCETHLRFSTNGLIKTNLSTKNIKWQAGMTAKV